MRLQFPEGFLLGVSSASAQIEGGADTDESMGGEK